jgi:hypothetical protein
MNFLRTVVLVCCVATALSSGVSAAPVFLQYESRNAVREGQGGERKTVDGVDFWMRGDPPKRYQIIGSLTDERHKTGLFGMIRMASLESDIANAAKAAGGDAVVLEGEGDETIGTVGSNFSNANGTYGNGSFNGNATNFGAAHAVKNHDSRYIVIKYLPEALEKRPLLQ